MKGLNAKLMAIVLTLGLFLPFLAHQSKAEDGVDFGRIPSVTVRQPEGGSPTTITFEDAGRPHGGICPGVALGYRACQIALDRLYPNEIPTKGDLFVVTSISKACPVDVVTHITGARYGKDLVFDPAIGDSSFIFAGKSGKTAVKLTSRFNLPPKEIDALKSLVESGKATPKEKEEFRRLRQSLSFKILILSEDQVFLVEDLPAFSWENYKEKNIKQLNIIAPACLKGLLKEVIAGFFEKEFIIETNITHYEDPEAQVKQIAASKTGDVFVADETPMEKAIKSGIILPDSRKIFFYKRMALGVQRKNPRSIFTIADLSGSGIRVAIVKPDKSYLGKMTQKVIKESGSRKELKKNIIFQVEKPDELAGLLISDKVDAVICWDTLENFDPGKIVIMRLPEKAAKSVLAGVIKFSQNEKMAGDLIEFISSDKSAKNAFRKYGYIFSDESRIRKSKFYKNFPSHPFFHTYQLLVQQIVDDYGIKKGVCLDVGCGGGQMLIDMARITELECVGLDIESKVIEVARENVSEAGFEKRIRFVVGDVHNLPLSDNFADIIMSRGSLPFWRDKVRAFQEIYRVLKPGGIAFVGGGGSRYLTDEYYNRRKVPWSKRSKEEKAKVRDKFRSPIHRIGDLNEILTRASIPKFKIVKQGGRWVEIWK